jgi:hypothetical protein
MQLLSRDQAGELDVQSGDETGSVLAANQRRIFTRSLAHRSEKLYLPRILSRSRIGP